MKYDFALKLNVMGVLRLWDLSKKFKNLCSFIHTSTSYVNSNKRGLIEEMVYQFDFDAEEKLIEYLNTPKEKLLSQEASILKKCGLPNTYTFTKALAEILLEGRKGDFPLCIVRLSIVGSAYIDPHLGWIDNAQAGLILN